MNLNIDAGPSRKWPLLFLECHAPVEDVHFPCAVASVPPPANPEQHARQRRRPDDPGVSVPTTSRPHELCPGSARPPKHQGRLLSSTTMRTASRLKSGSYFRLPGSYFRLPINTPPIPVRIIGVSTKVKIAQTTISSGKRTRGESKEGISISERISSALTEKQSVFQGTKRYMTMSSGCISTGIILRTDGIRKVPEQRI